MNETKKPSESLVRLPGLFRRWEIERVVGVGVEFLIESAGIDCDGSEFFVIYRKESVRCLSDVIRPLSRGAAGLR